MLPCLNKKTSVRVCVWKLLCMCVCMCISERVCICTCPHTCFRLKTGPLTLKRRSPSAPHPSPSLLLAFYYQWGGNRGRAGAGKRRPLARDQREWNSREKLGALGLEWSEGHRIFSGPQWETVLEIFLASKCCGKWGAFALTTFFLL